MKEIQNKYQTPGSHNMQLPISTKEAKEKYNKYVSNKISLLDFCTEFGGLPGFQSQKAYSSILWTLKNSKGGTWNWII